MRHIVSFMQRRRHWHWRLWFFTDWVYIMSTSILIHCSWSIFSTPRNLQTFLNGEWPPSFRSFKTILG
jgi:hypothetical protein